MAASAETQMLVAIALLPPSLRFRAEAYPFPQLHNACLDGDLELVGALCDAGLSPDMYPCTGDEDDVTPLAWIAEYYDGPLDGAARIVQFLVGLGADVDEGFPLVVAAERNDAGLVKVFVQAGADRGAALDELPTESAAALINASWDAG